MADASVVNIGENSPEQVAFKLLIAVGTVEQKYMNGWRPDVTRKWILDTYAECLVAVKGGHVIGNG